MHANEADLSLGPAFDKKKLLTRFGITLPSLESKSSSSEEEKSSASLTDGSISVDGLRLSPLDRKEGVYSAVEYVNIHLIENRVLITCQAALCKLLGDARSAGADEDSSLMREPQHSSLAVLNEQLVVGEQAAKVSSIFITIRCPCS